MGLIKINQFLLILIISIFTISLFLPNQTIHCIDLDFWAWNKEDWEDNLPIWFKELWWQPKSFRTMPYQEAFKAFNLLDQIWDSLNNKVNITITFKGGVHYDTTVIIKIIAREINEPQLWITIENLKGVETQLLLVPKDFINTIFNSWEPFNPKDITSTFDEVASDYNFYHSLRLQYLLNIFLKNSEDLFITVQGSNGLEAKLFVSKYDRLRSYISIVNNNGYIINSILIYTSDLPKILHIETSASSIWHLPDRKGLWLLLTSIATSYLSYSILHSQFLVSFDSYYSFVLPWENDFALLLFYIPIDTVKYSIWFSSDLLGWWIWGYPQNWWLEWPLIEDTYDFVREYRLKRVYKFFRWLFYARSDLGPFFPRFRN